MISRLNLRLLSSFKPCSVINQVTCAFSTHKTYRTLILMHEKIPNLKPGYKFKTFSTVSHNFQDVVEEDKFEDKSNVFGLKYYQNYMQNNPDYHGSVFNIETVKEETKDSKNELLLAFRNLIEDESVINEEMVNDFQKKLTDERKWLNYYELTELVHGLVHNETLKCNFEQQLVDMLTLLNSDCFDRVNENSIDQNLCLAQVWCDVDNKLNVPDQFLFKCKTKYFYKFHRLSKTQAAVFFYLISRRRRFPVLDNEYVIWKDLENLFPFCTVDEIALISRTFGMTRIFGLTDKNCIFILNKLTDEINNCNEVAIRDALKGLQFCHKHYQDQPELEKFQQSLANFAEKFSIFLLLDALYLGIHRNVCNKDLLNTTLNRIKNNMDSYSLRTVIKFLNILASFNITDAEFFELVIKKVKNNLDTGHKGEIIQTVYNLVLLNTIPLEIISKILTTEFQQELKFQKFELARKLSAFLDVTLDIEKPDYVGPRMTEKSRIKNLRRISFSVSDSKKFDCQKHVYTLEEAIKKYSGVEDSVAYKVMLPHFGLASIVLKLDKNLKGQEIQELFEKKIIFPTQPVKAPCDGHYWFAFRLLKISAYALKDELGAQQLYYNRHLRKLGYIPVTIKYSEWYSIKKDESLQLQLIENKIKEALG